MNKSLSAAESQTAKHSVMLIGSQSDEKSVILSGAQRSRRTCCSELRLNNRLVITLANIALSIGVSMAISIPAHAATESAQQQFQQVSDEYLDQVYFPAAPTVGTLSG